MSSRYSPKQPGNDIDVYFSPLINDMKTLWKPGVEMYDAYMKEKFRLHAMIFCTINDFPAYGNLSGYITKGKQACLICEDETSSRWLDNCKKTVFIGHRRSLPSNHTYRGMILEFDGRTDLLGLLLNIPGKTKDGINARKDMVSWGIRTKTWYTKRHNEQFATWLKDKVAANMGQPNVDRIVERLGEGPRLLVKTYQGYEINGYTFYTKTKDEKSTVQNSGVTMIASTGITKKSYYGVIQEIWELDYYTFKIPLFMCKWVNNSSGVKVNDYGFTLIDLRTDGYTSEPFILAKQATQVFFVQDPSNPRWYIVMPGKRHILGVDNVVDEE
nr:hypothetical protein [Tanacetum cinerariifolium]